MACVRIGGPLTVSATRDDEGYREYSVVWLVKSDLVDGPANVMQTANLPQIGDQWNFGVEVDIWAFCYPTLEVTIHQEKEGDPVRWWRVKQKFSTKFRKRCATAEVADPLNEPQKISGSFVKHNRERMRDRFGDYIYSSSFEQIRGPQVEFEDVSPTVKIEQNVALLELGLFSGMVNTVNDSTLWGLPSRAIKLGNATWARLLYGQCNYYYTRTFDFEVGPYVPEFGQNTFDRRILDEGTKALRGHWHKNAAELAAANTNQIAAGVGPAVGEWVLDKVDGQYPNYLNPQHYNRYKDRNEENTRAILNGFGQPLPFGASPAFEDVEFAEESNFLLLQIPTTL